MDEKKWLRGHKNNSSFFFFFLIFIARDVGGELENVYNLNILPLKLKYAFRKIFMIDDTKK